MKILHRDIVYNELNNILSYPLTIVTAPMGYGKSTAVKSFLSKNKINNIWMSLSETSRNIDHFWFLLTHKISSANNELGVKLSRLGFPQDNLQIERIVDLSISHALDKDLVFVLDDYHFAESNKLNDFLELMAKQEIPKFHSVIISRYLLRKDMTGLAVKNLIYNINEDILRFSDSDVTRYFNNMSMPMNKSKIRQIQNIADGWAAALYLIYRGLEQGIPLENITEIQSLLKSAVYDLYDEETKKALCSLSQLSSFTLELAAYSTEIESIGNIIDKLYRENSFVYFDRKTKLYTIHNVFQNFLMNESLKMNIDIKKIHQRAGLWYLEKNIITEAFYYLDKAGDYESILKELEKPSSNFKASDTSLLLSFFDKIPAEVNKRHPIAYLKSLMLFINSGDKKSGSILLEKFENELDPDAYSDDIIRKVKASIFFVKVFLAFNNLELMLSHIDAAYEILKEDCSVTPCFQGPFSFGSPHLSYVYYKEASSYKKTIGMPLEKYLRLSGQEDSDLEALLAAEYALESGNFESVEVNALKTFCQAKTKRYTSMMVCAVFTLARLYIYQNNYSEAFAFLDELHDEISLNIDTTLLNSYDLCLGYLYACMGEYEKIPRWIREGNISINSLTTQGAAFSYVVYGKSLVLSRNWSMAEALCETFNAYFRILNNQLGFLHNYINLSIISFSRGNEEKAKSWIEKALIIGAADDIIMPFCENAVKLLPILKCYAENLVEKEEKDIFGISVEYITRLTKLCTDYYVKVSSRSFIINPLSSRETEVLKLIADGLSRNDIAEELIISTGTVRTHVQNIYRKLEVNKKIDALNKASKLNLI